MTCFINSTDQSDTPTLRFSPFGEPLPSVAVKPSDLVLHSQTARRMSVSDRSQEAAEGIAMAALRRIADHGARYGNSAETARYAIAVVRDALALSGGYPIKTPAEEAFRSSVG